MATVEADEVEGSWTPTILIAILLLCRWLVYGEGNLAVSIRRGFSTQRVQFRKRFGYRDETKYKMGAGEGASDKYQRQG